MREEQSRLASLERASPLASITLCQDILTSKLLGAVLHEKLMAARRVVLFARLSPLVLGLLHEEHEVCQQAAEGRSCAAGLKGATLSLPGEKARRETNDVKHRPRAATPVRHLGAAGSDGIMRRPQAVTARASEVVNHIKAELGLFGQSRR